MSDGNAALSGRFFCLFSLTSASTPTTPAALCSHIPLPFYIPSSTFLPNSFTERTLVLHFETCPLWIRNVTGYAKEALTTHFICSQGGKATCKLVDKREQLLVATNKLHQVKVSCLINEI
jgi:hypothetical protein